MAFVLPSSKYKTVAEAPTPTDPRVTLRQLPERVQAVRTFTWSFKPEAAKSQLQRSTYGPRQRQRRSSYGPSGLQSSSLGRMGPALQLWRLVSAPPKTPESPDEESPRVVVRPARQRLARQLQTLTLTQTRQLLLADLAVDEWSVVKRADGEAEWQAAGYNPPFTLPFLKTNEVMVSVQPKA